MRLPDLDPAAFDEHQQSLFDSITSSRPEAAALGLTGPFGVWLHSPKLGSDIVRLGGRVRFGTSLSPNVTEVAICTTGAHYRAKFEFAAHRSLALRAGVDEAKLDRLANREDPGFDGDEAAAYAVASELLASHRVSSATYDDALARFGDAGMVELVTIVGYYCNVSLTLNAFEVQLPPNMVDPFPNG